ncbi:molybdopterin-dependent oxidoreductase [Propionibacteriaceae bacterium Y1685]|uniref:molybdopterin-dependent oxidoreductase n=1 Tax=Microlunatus sp. Y1700 TaxID=3418487 RepID=UPI003B7E8813
MSAEQRAEVPATVEPVDRRWVAASGVVATLAGLVVAELFAWGIAPTGSPLQAIGTWLIDIFPAPLINFGKDTLGTLDKPILIIIVGLVALVLGACAALLHHRRRHAGWLIMIPLALLCGWAAIRAGRNPVFDVLPTLAAVGIAAPLIRALLDRLDPPGARMTITDDSRRQFLQWFAGTSIVTGILGIAGLTMNRQGSPSAPPPPLPAPATPAPPVPAGVDLGVDGLTPYITPNADFYRIDTALVVPRIKVEDWSLTITGLVDREVTITWADLVARPMVEHVLTLACVSNTVGGDLVGNATWLGVPIRDLLAEAGPQEGADMVLSTSHDGFTAGSPLEVLMEDDRQALLAIGMNGETLPYEHGFPARLVVPGLYGYVSATKWVTELKVTTFAQDEGYWTPLGWSALGPIKLASRIDVPRSKVGAGEVVVAGVAWAQHTGISAVEVQVDDGPWQKAELAPVTGPDTWRQWSWTWPDATPGEHRLTCRATDADGAGQETAFAPPAPNGATGLHTRTVTVS